MKIKSYQRILLFFFLLVPFLTGLLSPWFVAFWELIRPWIAELWELVFSVRPEWKEHSFSRFFNRTYMILGIALFFPCRRFLMIGSLSQLGLPSSRHRSPDLLTGFFLAVVSLILLGVAMSLTDVFTPYFRLPFIEGLKRSLNALLTAITVGLLEEIFFRGMILKGLLEDCKPPGAFVAASLFYAALHFAKPVQKTYLVGFDPWAGLRHIPHIFERFLDPLTILPGLLSLFFFGLVLSYAFLRTGSLYLSIGLHAGWIFAIKTIRVYGTYTREELGWLFGSSDPKIVSGFATWIGILAVGVIIHWMTRKRQRLKTAT